MFDDDAVNFGLLYWSFSVSVNIMATVLIVGRLLYMRHQISKAVGLNQTPHVYVSVSAMLVESAALYSCMAIVFIVGYATKQPFQFVVEPAQNIQVRAHRYVRVGVCLQACLYMQAVTTLMIIHRVAKGSAFSGHALSGYTRTVTGMQFASTVTDASTTRERPSAGTRPVLLLALGRNTTSSTSMQKNLPTASLSAKDADEEEVPLEDLEIGRRFSGHVM
jgi:hypothetical protein